MSCKYHCFILYVIYETHKLMICQREDHDIYHTGKMVSKLALQASRVDEEIVGSSFTA